jgi:hypothetical protein
MGNNRAVRGGYIPNLHHGISSSETPFLLEARGGKYNQGGGDAPVDTIK